MFVEHRNTEFGAEKNRIPGDRRRDRLGHHQRAPWSMCSPRISRSSGGSLSETHAQKTSARSKGAMKPDAGDGALQIIGLPRWAARASRKAWAASRAMAKCSNQCAGERRVRSGPDHASRVAAGPGGDVYHRP